MSPTFAFLALFVLAASPSPGLDITGRIGNNPDEPAAAAICSHQGIRTETPGMPADEADSGFVYTSRFKASNTINRKQGTRVTEMAMDTCNGPIPVKTVIRDTSRFAIRGGKLFQWRQGQCAGEVMTGGHADVVGSWSLAESQVPLPRDLRPAACKDTLSAFRLPAGLQGRLTISETEQSLELTEEICPPDGYLPLIVMLLLEDPTIELTRHSCRQLVFRNGDDQEAVLSFAKRGDSLASTFTHGSSTCFGLELMSQGNAIAIDCTGENPVLGFLACLAATGYFGGGRPEASPLIRMISNPGLESPSPGKPARRLPPDRPAWRTRQAGTGTAPERGIFPYHGRGWFPAS